ncbi:uncharacterized protein LOC133785708 [Humulus lupulus]|uniref:uncharacterized protein LOC133785708 n=1 Tax=Humulus lupulus TaxID=3486 RepID=UPI002B41127D|nr:uncharacterized protein LOC133785708 [Humulus lupulus]
MMSDRQKGLENAVGAIFSGCEVRFCVRHLHANFKKEYPGLLLKQLLWAAANTTTQAEFARAMQEVKNVSDGAYNWLAGNVQCSNGSALVVDLEFRTCTCRRFQLSGLPCGHARATIWFMGGNVFDYVHGFYKKESLQKAYEQSVHPMPSPDMWPQTGLNPIDPPPETKLPGRPKKARRRETDEPPPALKKA